MNPDQTVRQLFAADDFSRRQFQMHYFLSALRVNLDSFFSISERIEGTSAVALSVRHIVTESLCKDRIFLLNQLFCFIFCRLTRTIAA